VLACNVAGPVVATAIDALALQLAAPLVWFRSSAAAAGVSNGYDRPTQLGADRWAALLGAHALHRGPILVVLAGTATTIDVLLANGRFAGGLILPGLTLMRQALARNTAGLPEARGTYGDCPTNTDDAIASGILHATLGAIERMAQRAFGTLPGAAATDGVILLSGGAADILAPHLVRPHRQVPNLVLDGLAHYDAISSAQ
jgi:type III pantothenate kinase